MNKRYYSSDIMKLPSTLRGKILIVYIIIGIVPLCLISIISFAIYYKSYINTAFERVNNSIKQIELSVNILFHDTEKYLEIRDYRAVQRFLATNENTPEDNESILDIFKLYRGLYKFNHDIEDIHIIGENGKCISEQRGVYNVKHGRSLFRATFRKLLENPNRVGIIHVSSGDYIKSDYNETILSIGKIILSPDKRHILGVVILNMNRDIINNYAETLSIGSTGSFYFFSDNRDLVFIENGNIINAKKIQNMDNIFRQNSGSYIEKISGENLVIAYLTSADTGIKLVGSVPVKEIMRDVYQWLVIIVFILLGVIIATFIASVYISKRLTHPIEYIISEINKAANGNLDIVLSTDQDDELANLSKSINIMIKRLKSIIEENMRENRERLKAELALMQQQINPHFLYNTLDTIVWMAESNKRKDVIKLVGSLSTFFRTSLSEGRSWVTVHDEIVQIKSYLNIQKMRYKNKLEYDIQISDSILEYPMLKLILQPLIENALYHGIKNRRGIGQIIVTGESFSENEIIFVIRDNGIGMTEEKLEDIKSIINLEFREKMNKGAFGLRNINRRIKLFYNDNYGLFLKSTYGEGTEVKLIIPKMENLDV